MAEAMLEGEYRSSPLPVLDVVSSASSSSSSLMSNLKKRSAIEMTQNNSKKPNQQQQETTGRANNNSPTRKHIVFKIPPKRQKLCTTSTTKQVIEAISATVTEYERFHALSEAALSFDHNIESAHDDELAEGAGPVLMKHLAFLLFKRHCLAESIQSRRTKNASNKNNKTDTPTTEKQQSTARPRSISNASSEEVQSVASISTEISQTVEVLEMVYRASVSAVSDSFNYVGQELLPLLITVIEDELYSRCKIGEDDNKNEQSSAAAVVEDNTATVKSDGGRKITEHHERRQEKRDQEEQEEAVEDDRETLQEDWSKNNNDDESQQQQASVPNNNEPGSRSVTPPSPVFSSSATTDLRGIRGGVSGVGTEESDLSLRKATKIIGHFARVSEATQQLAFHPRLLGSLRNTISFSPFMAVPSEARLNSLWILANLACNSENMVMMACHPGLLQMLVSTLFRTPQDGDSTDVVMQIFRSHSIACRALHNLAWAPANKIPMSENGALVEALSRMILQRTYLRMNRPHGTSSILLQTRRHAAGALRNLAQAPRRNKIRLIQYGCGSFLDTLIDAARNDPDNIVSDKALATIHNLACVDTAETMIAKPEVLSLLKDTIEFVTRNSEDFNNTNKVVKRRDEQDDTRLEDARGTLTVLQRSITEDMASYPTLRDFLKELDPPANEEDNDENNTASDTEDNHYSSNTTL
mmetsp:Transcript_2078/g.3181  ORF Transcript_2078/g.3181 Transcript_2078/m.3181 type:complete len:699 (-) Transcript_2078:374-2470(-)|eukprot:CAMPEP_0195303748 /NCGR_PEP_ID=MMETSP0707-20130614/33298_1 /TAXON_ID=33640 /ORGANISM="Asterionellopsis glacialis, Strain CCMP134" /LENGTH=698 /DNA_ID=CAMNT_0040367381 /DNA_START=101 /DNA_END=2197 /DNA_ORIENTATION=-